MSFRHIEGHINISQGAISRLLDYNQTGEINVNQCCGRLHKTSPRDNRFFTSYGRTGYFPFCQSTLPKMQAAEIIVSCERVNKLLLAGGLPVCQPLKGSHFTDQHRDHHFASEQVCQNWNLQTWH